MGSIESSDALILCISRDHLPATWLASECALPLKEKKLYEPLAGIPVCWRLRSAAEQDPAFKQIIPYVLMHSEDGRKIACYQRTGTEKRLHALWSVGIGGHIEYEDERTRLSETIQAGMLRELSEELNGFQNSAQPAFIGVINEERTSVGQVHLGLVYRLCVDEEKWFSAGAELSRFQWMEKQKVSALDLELWSRLALDLL